jgi:endonuclease IV
VIGRSFAELGRLIAGVRHARLQVCIDTCHAFAAGYNIAELDGFEITMMEFDNEIGLERLAVLHANDSKLPLGGERDRHENIGDGHIGAEGFRTILGAEELRGKAALLEVPGIPDEHGKADGPDAENVRRLKQLRNETGSAVEGSSPTKRSRPAASAVTAMKSAPSEDDQPSPGTRPPSGGSRRAGGARRPPSE